ncbi:N-acetyltransferase [Brucella melitensis]|uniref:Phosphinothricin N-acetyltransferase n=2 Tax=Brucella melitensis TaxID=29459 RepID=C0RGE9_BRUMB|nr:MULTISPECIES: GNAT family N-acetyltransferase [Brucella]EXU83879.1 GCN5 family N-acetyltransferase [Brucella melitensis 548]ACN99906.1 Phosphinothricin N-acetyltransferase [Brucella melitensis ATCC 23457]ADZ65167.1 phosphinothricin N-acetyltransferase [Brucella melitensis M28]ADZ86031.1 phosphinothricin N-acetyltransferase [Brucella melitensis M5-90]AEQ07717.1 phosphinothricin N-acetyltransferase [Brucella melitensis NI]
MPVIRDFQPADIETITAIYTQAVLTGTGSYEIEPPTMDEMAKRFAAFADQGFPILVAEADGRVLGYAYASYFRVRPAYRWLAEDSIYIAPDAKGQGIGKLLLRELIARISALGFRQLLAVIGDGEHNIGSVKLHESLGFTHCGRIEGSGFKHERWLDTVLMQLPLNGGRSTEPGPSPLS